MRFFHRLLAGQNEAMQKLMLAQVGLTKAVNMTLELEALLGCLCAPFASAAASGSRRAAAKGGGDDRTSLLEAGKGTYQTNDTPGFTNCRSPQTVGLLPSFLASFLPC